jgi:hypothetical protein
MRNMGQFELAEETWQVQFEKDRSIGEKAADYIVF